MLLNVLDDEVGSGEVIDSRWTFGIVHRIGHVAHERDVLSELHHLAYAEWPPENAHVEVHAAEDDIVDLPLL